MAHYVVKLHQEASEVALSAYQIGKRRMKLPTVELSRAYQIGKRRVKLSSAYQIGMNLVCELREGGVGE